MAIGGISGGLYDENGTLRITVPLKSNTPENYWQGLLPDLQKNSHWLLLGLAAVIGVYLLASRK